ncbi:MAG: DUF4390 domain-containing protein [Pseudomonadota bacterium]
MPINRLARALRWTFALGLLMLAFHAGLARSAEVVQLRTERTDDGVFLSALISFDIAPAVEDALLKGIPMFFVAEADISRERWYWTDKRVASAARTIRLAYQPLTRRWRINVAAGIVSSSSGLRASLNQSYDTLAEALVAVQRLTRWKIAEAGDIDPGARHELAFSFRLDLSQLPRPFQIGVAGQRDWTIAAEVTQRLDLVPVRSSEFVPKEPVQEAAVK